MSFFPHKKNSETAIDLVLCVDNTGAHAPIHHELARHAPELIETILECINEYGSVEKDRLRIKVIRFKDYCIDADPMEESPFFSIDDPSGKKQFFDFLNSFHSCGGGDEPESSLEALVTAIRSDWKPRGAHYRQIIVLFTDATPHNLGDEFSIQSPLYPAGMPKDFAELTRIWEEGDKDFAPHFNPRRARLILFAPAVVDTWRTIGYTWDRAMWVQVDAGLGCSDVDTVYAWQVIASAI